MQIPIQINVKGEMVVGIMHIPERSLKGNPVIIAINGLNGNRVEHQRMLVQLGERAEKNGIALLRFDSRGLGLSEGEFWNTTVESKLEDIKCIIDFLKGCYRNNLTVFFLGYSDGAKLILNLLETSLDKEHLAGMLLWSPVLLPVNGELKKKKMVREPNTKAMVFPFGGLWIGVKYIRDVSIDKDFLTPIHEFNKPLMCIFGTNDEKTTDLINIMKTDKYKNVELSLIEDAGHTFQDKVWTEEVINNSIEWIIRQNT